MHRFDIDNYEFVKLANNENWKAVSISVGVNKVDYETLKLINQKNLRVDFITVDVAHGHHLLVKQMLDFIKQNFKKTFIIAGNIVTEAAAADLTLWGANAIKVGIGQGYVCTTKDKTGFTYPMFSCVLELAKKYTVVADGGIRCTGDIAKALAAGAKMVMCGSIFAKLKDSPAKTVINPSDNKKYKEYYGSASFQNKNKNKNIEGKTELIELEDKTYLEKIKEIQEDLQSAISYAGGSALPSLRRAKWDSHITV
jgi:GMP reductase